MLKKIIQWMLGLCILIGIIIVIGALGDSDLNKIGVAELVKRGLTGSGLVLISYIILRLTGWDYID